MNKKAVWGIVAVVIIVLIALTISNVSNKKPFEVITGKPIVIGAPLSLSGAAVQDGESIKNGLEMAKADLAKKGVNVDIIYQDDQTDGKGTVSAIRALAAKGAQALIGPTWSFLADAGVPVADQLGLVTVMPANTSEYVGAKSPYAFFTTIKVHQLVPALAQWLKDNDKKSIAIVSNQGSWYSTVEKAVREAAASVGASIVFTDTLVFGQEASTLPTVLTKMKASKADVLFMEVDSDDGVAVMFKKIRELGMTQDIMSISTSLGRVLRANPDGFNFSNKVYVLAPKTSEAFTSKYESVYGQKPSAYADTAYDSLMLLVDAIENKGSLPLADYLRTKTNYKGLSHEYKFDSNGDIVGGEWVVDMVK
ncbi:MAG: ABC transporter substrate-binding protein [Candidatus Paceibacterota bacterium]